MQWKVMATHDGSGSFLSTLTSLGKPQKITILYFIDIVKYFSFLGLPVFFITQWTFA